MLADVRGQCDGAPTATSSPIEEAFNSVQTRDKPGKCDGYHYLEELEHSVGVLFASQDQVIIVSFVPPELSTNQYLRNAATLRK